MSDDKVEPCDDRIRYEIKDDARVTLQITIDVPGPFHSDTVGGFLDDPSPTFKGKGKNLNWPINPTGGNLMLRELELTTTITNKSEGNFEVIISYDLSGGEKLLQKKFQTNTSPGKPVTCTLGIKFIPPIS